MKIRQTGENTFSVEDFRGKFVVHNDEVVSLLDNQGVLHLPMDTPGDNANHEHAVCDLDKRTGHVAHIAFGAQYCISTSRLEFNDNFEHSNCDGYYIYIDNGNFTELSPKYSLASGKDLRDLLMVVVSVIYEGVGVFDGFKELKHEFFDNCSWRNLTFDDIMDMWTTYRGDLDYNQFERHPDVGEARLKSDHPLNDLVYPNFQLYPITGFCQGQYDTVIVFTEVAESFDVFYDMTDMFTNMFYCAPVMGLLVVAGKQYDVQDYIKDNYEWDADQFLNTFFEAHNYNKSMQRLIKECIVQHGDLDHV